MVRRILLPLLMFLGTVGCSVGRGQANPQFLRDYIYGPGGKLIATSEPDVYGPVPGTGSGSWSQHVCSYSVSLSWSGFVDIGGSGLAGYKIYKDGSFLLSTTSTSYTDHSVSGDTSYDYDIYGYDNAGNVGTYPADIGVDVGDCHPEESFFAVASLWQKSPGLVSGSSNVSSSRQLYQSSPWLAQLQGAQTAFGMIPLSELSSHFAFWKPRPEYRSQQFHLLRLDLAQPQPLRTIQLLGGPFTSGFGGGQ
jgi:hypothetical protein